jgi:hypothetical protein
MRWLTCLPLLLLIACSASHRVVLAEQSRTLALMAASNHSELPVEAQTSLPDSLYRETQRVQTEIRTSRVEADSTYNVASRLMEHRRYTSAMREFDFSASVYHWQLQFNTELRARLELLARQQELTLRQDRIRQLREELQQAREERGHE